MIFYVCIGAEGHETGVFEVFASKREAEKCLKRNDYRNYPEMHGGGLVNHSKLGFPNICGHPLTIRKFEVKTKKEIMELMNELAGSWWNLA
tara:strand:+ start:98 stop:370 length:273 start_codon:yes stop_codon:yes gene_type:complete